jgi:hypothetical protein
MGIKPRSAEVAETRNEHGSQQTDDKQNDSEFEQREALEA